MSNVFPVSIGTSIDLFTLAGTRNISDTVTPSLPNDFYRFSVGSASQLNLRLFGSSNNVDIQLIQDRNRNRLIEPNEILGWSAQGGNTVDVINAPVVAGEYFIQVYSGTTGANTSYSISATATTLSNPNYTDPNAVRSYFGTGVTRSFYNSVGISTYQAQTDSLIMYGAIANYYSNNAFNNPDAGDGLLGVYSGLGIPTSPIYVRQDETQVMEFEGGTLINRNNAVTVAYNQREGDRFDLVGQGAPNGQELFWKNDYSWFSRDMGRPIGSVRRINNGWIQEFQAVNSQVGDSILIIKDGQPVLGSVESYTNNLGTQVDTPRGGPYRVQGGILYVYRLAGGHERISGGLGFPIQHTRGDANGYRAYQAFENGFIAETYNNQIIVQNQQGQLMGVVGYDGTHIASTYINTFDRNGGMTALGHAASTVRLWGDGFTQNFSGGTAGAGAIMKSNANDNSYWVGGNIWNTFLQLNSVNGLLKYPTSDRYTINGGWRQDFQGGAILQSQVGTFAVYGGIGQKYLSLGGQTSFLDLPTSGETGIGNGWTVQHFQNGVIRWNGTAIAFDTDIWNRYEQTGGASGILRNPTSDTYRVNGGLRQDFQGGAIFETPRGVFTVYGGIGSKYLSLGEHNSFLGLPTSGEAGIGNGWIVQHFENGIIQWNGTATAFDLDIWNRYEQLGGAHGTLRNSTSDTYQINGGLRQDFQGGAIFETSRGVFAVFGGVGGKYLSLGGQNSFLGLPTSGEIGIGNGWIVQNFENGIIQWNGAATAFDIDIWNRYQQLGGTSGILRNSTSDTHRINGGLKHSFQDGTIYETPRGVFSVVGGIGTYYFNTANGESGRLGLPTGGENGLGNGIIRQDFENGYIIWNGRSATGYNREGSLLFPPPSTPVPQPGGTGNYLPGLASLTSDQWDRYTGDNTRFDGAIWAGERDERHLTPVPIQQVYTDLSTAIFGRRFKMTAGYLFDTSYRSGYGLWHAGIDIGAPAGTSVRSLIKATVAWTDTTNAARNGIFVGIRDSSGRVWVYGHLQSLGGLRAGQQINAGQVIGQVGNQQDARHLHLEVRTSNQGTGGAHRNQDFLRNVTMSPLEAFWTIRRASNPLNNPPSTPTPQPVREYEEIISLGNLRQSWTGNNSLTQRNTIDYYTFRVTRRTNFRAQLAASVSSIEFSILADGDRTVSSRSSTGNLNWILEAGTYKIRVHRRDLASKLSYSLAINPIALSGNIKNKDKFYENGVNLYRYDASGNRTWKGIEANKNTIVVTHGWTSNSENLKSLLSAAANFFSGHQILALDWSNPASEPGVPYHSAKSITPVANWAKQALENLGIAAGQISLFGHSLGSYVSAEIGRLFNKVKSIVALDPAWSPLARSPLAWANGDYDIDGNVAGKQTVKRFDEVAHQSTAFVVSDEYSIGDWAGDANRAATAHDSFIVRFDSLNPSTSNGEMLHGAVVDIFGNILEQRISSFSGYSTNSIAHDGTSYRFIRRRNQHEGVVVAKQRDGKWKYDKLMIISGSDNVFWV